MYVYVPTDVYTDRCFCFSCIRATLTLLYVLWSGIVQSVTTTRTQQEIYEYEQTLFQMFLFSILISYILFLISYFLFWGDAK